MKMNESLTKITQSDNINELATALSSLQTALEGAKKDSTNPYFKSKYADLEAVWEAARPLLKPNGLAVTQTMGYFIVGETPITTLITTLMHTSGQWKSGEMPLLLKTQDPQGQGSAITYARRYGLTAMLGIHQTDDDGQSASPRNGQTHKAETIKRIPIIDDSFIDVDTGEVTQSEEKPLTSAEMTAFLREWADKGLAKSFILKQLTQTCGITLTDINERFTPTMQAKLVAELVKHVPEKEMA
jgi:hypothetical protein